MIYSIRKKYLIALLLLALTALPGELGDLTRALVTDAYVQVSAFVAITLSIFYLSEHRFNFNIGNVLRESSAFQIPIAAIGIWKAEDSRRIFPTLKLNLCSDK